MYDIRILIPLQTESFFVLLTKNLYQVLSWPDKTSPGVGESIVTTIEKAKKRLQDGSIQVELWAISAHPRHPSVRLEPALEIYQYYIPLIAAILISSIEEATSAAFDSAQASTYQPPLFTRLVNGLIKMDGENPLSITMIFARSLQDKLPHTVPAANLEAILAIAHAVASAASERVDRIDTEAAMTEAIVRNVSARATELPSDATSQAN